MQFLDRESPSRDGDSLSSNFDLYCNRNCLSVSGVLYTLAYVSMRAPWCCTLCVALCWRESMCVDVCRRVLHGVAPCVLHCVGACRCVSTRAPWCCTLCVALSWRVSTHAPWCCSLCVALCWRVSMCVDVCRLMLHCVAHLSTPGFL